MVGHEASRAELPWNSALIWELLGFVIAYGGRRKESSNDLQEADTHFGVVESSELRKRRFGKCQGFWKTGQKNMKARPPQSWFHMAERKVD